MVELFDQDAGVSVAPCEHDWIDITNPIVSGGMWCPGCGSIDDLDPDTLAALSIEELKTRYPEISWKS